MPHQDSVSRQEHTEGALPQVTTAGAKTPALLMPLCTLFAGKSFSQDFQGVLYNCWRGVKQFILPILCLIFHE